MRLPFRAYRKLIAAFVGILVMLTVKHSGLDLRGLEDMIVDGLLALATLWGVWGFRNDPLPSKSEPIEHVDGDAA